MGYKKYANKSEVPKYSRSPADYLGGDLLRIMQIPAGPIRAPAPAIVTHVQTLQSFCERRLVFRRIEVSLDVGWNDLASRALVAT